MHIEKHDSGLAICLKREDLIKALGMTEKDVDNYIHDITLAGEDVQAQYSDEDEDIFVMIPLPGGDELKESIERRERQEKAAYQYRLDTLNEAVGFGFVKIPDVTPLESTYLKGKFLKEWKKIHGIQTEEEYEALIQSEKEEEGADGFDE